MNGRFWSGQIVVLLLIASVATTPAAQQQPRFDALVREDFFAGFAGDMVRFERAMTLIEQMLAKDPDNVQIMSWHGAGVFYRSNAAFQKGDMQGATKLLQAGVDDFETVLRLQQAKFDQLSIHSKGELLMGLADGWNRLGDSAKARQYFERIASDTQLRGSVYAEKARTWLADAPESKVPAFFNCTGCHRREDLTAPARQ